MLWHVHALVGALVCSAAQCTVRISAPPSFPFAGNAPDCGSLPPAPLSLSKYKWRGKYCFDSELNQCGYRDIFLDKVINMSTSCFFFLGQIPPSLPY